MELSTPRLCLNMIVRNEEAILPRALGSIADHISYWVICDTGSTDGTPDLVATFFAQRGIPGELHSFPFDDFGTARNRALELARRSTGPFDYLLLADADMELHVEDPGFRRNLAAPGYQVKQKSGITYWNTRLLHRDAPSRYRGVTHEYLELKGQIETLDAIWFTDRSDGANRPGKFERDIRLLEVALERDPGDSRSMFYLAQSYRDAGQMEKAAATFARRFEMGGWEEERWYALVQEARCRHVAGDDAGFLAAAARACQLRPTRAEPLYDLARFYRLHGQYETAMLLCEMAAGIRWPAEDRLFIEDYVYTTGIRQEIAVAGYYCQSERRRSMGRLACNDLAIDVAAPDAVRRESRRNLAFYARTASALMPSFESRQLLLELPIEGRPMNPSVAVRDGAHYAVVRVVNYETENDTRYRVPDGVIRSRNVLVRLDANLQPHEPREILPPADFPSLFPKVLGFEDMRLFAWRGSLWCSATVLERTPEGWCEIVLSRLDETPQGIRLADWRVLTPAGPRRHEKNWMPRVAGDRLEFIYGCDPVVIVDEGGRTIGSQKPAAALDHLRGGSQAIAFGEGWLALTHEVSIVDRRREYLHRFVWFDNSNALRRVTEPFYFLARGLEFAAGLAMRDDGETLIVSFGARDSEAWIATVSSEDVRAALRRRAAAVAAGEVR